MDELKEQPQPEPGSEPESNRKTPKFQVGDVILQGDFPIDGVTRYDETEKQRIRKEAESSAHKTPKWMGDNERAQRQADERGRRAKDLIYENKINVSALPDTGKIDSDEAKARQKMQGKIEAEARKREDERQRANRRLLREALSISKSDTERRGDERRMLEDIKTEKNDPTRESVLESNFKDITPRYLDETDKQRRIREEAQAKLYENSSEPSKPPKK